MKTTVIMKREFNGADISQRTSDKFFNATELLKHYTSFGGKNKVIAEFWSNKSTKEFMEALSNDLNSNIGNSLYSEKDLYTTTRGKDGGTYMHPYLFVKFAMWLSPEFEVQIIKWVYDNLIDYRNEAGDHYVEMAKAIQDTYQSFYKSKPDPLVFIKEANYLNTLVFGVSKGKKRNDATEKELDKLNRLQLANIKLINESTPILERKKKLLDFANLL